MRSLLLFYILLQSTLLFSQQDVIQPYTDFWDEAEKHKRTEGMYRFGFEDSLWTRWYKSGKIEEQTNYKMGVFYGKSTKYYENGQKKWEDFL